MAFVAQLSAVADPAFPSKPRETKQMSTPTSLAASAALVETALAKKGLQTKQVARLMAEAELEVPAGGISVAQLDAAIRKNAPDMPIASRLLLKANMRLSGLLK